ncbi:MAG: hypothetical protein V9F06_03740 [Thermomicrobiales bacterium]
MTKTKGILIGVGALVAFIIVIVGLYLLGGERQSALERLRDIVIVLIGLISVVMTILLVVVSAVLVWVAFAIKDKIIPMLEQLTETASRVKGTASFMTEEVASPMISFYGNIAKARAMVKTAAGRDRKGKGVSTLPDD